MKLANLYPIIADHCGISDYQLQDLLIKVGNELEDTLQVQMDVLDESQAKLILDHVESFGIDNGVPEMQHWALYLAICAQLGHEIHKLELENTESVTYDWNSPHHKHTIEKWQDEAFDSETLRGYNEWVYAKLEEEASEPETDEETGQAKLF